MGENKRQINMDPENDLWKKKETLLKAFCILSELKWD